MAAATLARLQPRRAVTLAAIILVANIAVPEIAYRAYNAHHDRNRKTPHGAVIYNHQWMAQRITRFDQLSNNVMKAARSPACRGVLVFTRWEGFAHAVYDVAKATPGFHPTSKRTFFESVQERSYEGDNRDFRFIHYVYFEDPELKRLGLHEIKARLDEGYAVFVPRELADGPLAGMLPATGTNIY